MTKVICTEPTNCWQAFLACIMGLPLSTLDACSTENDDWKKQTDELLARFDTFVVEVEPTYLTAIPHGMLLGGNTKGPNGLPHIVIIMAVKEGERQSFVIHHDPSGFYPAGTPINPPTVVLACRAIR